MVLDEYGIFRSIIIVNYSFVGFLKVGLGFSKGGMVGIKIKVMLFF